VVFSCFNFSLAQYEGMQDFEKAAILFSEYGKDKTKTQKLDSAALIMDKAFEDPKISNMAAANKYSAAIFKERYKLKGILNPYDELFKISIERFTRSWDLDTSKKNRDELKTQFKWFSVQFNNDIAKSLEGEQNIERAQKSFSEFKRIYSIFDPAFDLKPKIVEFELACGTALLTLAEKTGKKEYYDLAKVSYLNVLEQDTANDDANFNMGIIYYNQGANLIMKVLDFDTPLDSISIIEEMAKKLFLQAKPFMHKANYEKPNCQKILEGLMGIYYSLNEEEYFKKYKALFEKLKSDIESGLIKEDC
jgi:hypothetical protein